MIAWMLGGGWYVLAALAFYPVWIVATSLSTADPNRVPEIVYILGLAASVAWPIGLVGLVGHKAAAGARKRREQRVLEEMRVQVEMRQLERELGRR